MSRNIKKYRNETLKEHTFITNLECGDKPIFQQAISIYKLTGYKGKFWFSDKATDVWGRTLKDTHLVLHGDSHIDMMALFHIVNELRDINEKPDFITQTEMKL